MNSERLKDIESFLSFLKKILRQDRNIIFTPDTLYHQLIRHNLSTEEKNFKVNKEYFDKWIERYQERPNIQVFVSDNWKYFCQFVPSSLKQWSIVHNSNNHIKLYIPLDSEHLYEGANQIFDFISENRIPHLSKIGSNIRTDNVVVRLLNPQDAEKVLDFVKNNQYIQEGLLKSNPFVPNEDNIAYTSDGYISYNQTIATILSDYMNRRNKEKKLRKVCLEDFRKYVEELKLSLTKDNLSPSELLRKSPLFFSTGMFYTMDSESKVKSLISVLEILNSSLKPDFKKQDYYDYYETALFEPTMEEEYDKETLELLRKGYKTLTERFGSEKDAFLNLKEYMKTGDLSYITSRDNLRRIYEMERMDERVKEFLLEKNLQFDEIMEKLFGDKKEPIENATSYLRYIWKVLSTKYDPETAFYNMIQYIKTGESEYMTKEQNIRKIVDNSDLRERVLNYLKEKNMSVDNFIYQIAGDLKSKEDYLKEAIMATYIKYEDRHQNGMIEKDGRDWSACALRSLIVDGAYNGFTRDMDARKNLMGMVTKEEVLKMISDKMNISEDEILQKKWDELKDFLEEYVTKLTELTPKKGTSQFTN